MCAQAQSDLPSGKPLPPVQFKTREYTVFHDCKPKPNTGRGGLYRVTAIKRNSSDQLFTLMDGVRLKTKAKEAYKATLHSTIVIADVGFSGTPTQPKFEAWVFSDSKNLLFRVDFVQIVKPADSVNYAKDAVLLGKVRAAMNQPPKASPASVAAVVDGAAGVLSAISPPSATPLGNTKTGAPVRFSI